MRIKFARLDCGASVGLALQVGGWRRGWRVRNPFFMHMPRIYALDLRSLEVRVAEWNARGGLQLRVWEPAYFRNAVHVPAWFPKDFVYHRPHRS